MDICKRFQFKNGEKTYVFSMKSINPKELILKLAVIHIKQINQFYDKKTLEEIHYEFSFLKNILTIKTFIEYLVNLLKKKNMKISRLNNSIYNIIFYDNDKNGEIKFFLVKNNDNNYEKMSIENEELKKKLNNMDQEIQSQKSKIENLEEIIQKLQANKESQIKPSIQQVDSENGSINKNLIISNSGFQSNFSSMNSEIRYSSVNQSIENSSIKQSYFYKENNNNILFKGDPNLLNISKYISEEEENSDECETFTAFNTKTNQPIIVWTVKNQNKSIFIKNWANNTKYCEKNAHNSKIDLLQYFYDDKTENNNEYIISLSKNDEEALKIWTIDFWDKNGLSLKLKSIITKKIDIFCTFSNKQYLYDNYLITYSRFNEKKKIICWKLDDNLNIIENDDFPIKVDTSNEVNFLDTYYNEKEQKLYLINCNNYDVNIIEQPLITEKKYISFKKSLCHLNALILEKNNNMELFDANGTGVFIWDYNNNDKPKYEFSIDISFDMCLWNIKYLWVSTNSGIKLINLEEKYFENTIDEDNGNRKMRNGSKVRKIETPLEYESLILINGERKLVMWSK